MSLAAATTTITAAAAQPELTGLAGFVVDVVAALGAAGVGLLVALENLFPPIPSEVVLPVAGYVASQGEMNLVAAIVLATVGALVGALILYALGALVGAERLRRWARTLPLVDVSDVDRSQHWFHRHGAKAVLFGRCVPVVRSLVSIPAGVARMPLVPFAIYTVLGSAVWNTGLILAGYLLGEQWEDIGAYSDWINRAVYLAIIAVIARFVIVRVLRNRGRARS